MEITHDKLLELNREGLIPGPGESIEAFFERAERCLLLKNSPEEITQRFPLQERELGEKGLLAISHDLTDAFFDITPSWIPLFFSNHKLMPWHGGCAWIFQSEADSAPLAFFQLNRYFARQDSFLGYSKRELIAHELSHVGRMSFEEPRFEEILAYRTSSKSYRRYLAPLVEYPYEGQLLLALFVLAFVVDIVALFSGYEGALSASMWWKALPLSYLGYLLVKLTSRHKTFRTCLDNLQQTVKCEKVANAIIYRLTDEEIALFSEHPEKIASYAQDQQDRSLRWRLIFRAYFAG